jgi:hypothetical protein
MFEKDCFQMLARAQLFGETVLIKVVFRNDREPMDLLLPSVLVLGTMEHRTLSK